MSALLDRPAVRRLRKALAAADAAASLGVEQGAIVKSLVFA